MKTALVTGGAKRIGAAIVKDLAANGFNVAVHSMSSIDAAKSLEELALNQGVKACAMIVRKISMGRLGIIISPFTLKHLPFSQLK